MSARCLPADPLESSLLHENLPLAQLSALRYNFVIVLSPDSHPAGVLVACGARLAAQRPRLAALPDGVVCSQHLPREAEPIDEQLARLSTNHKLDVSIRWVT